MKNIFKLILLSWFLFLPSASHAMVDSVDRGYAEKINNFDVNIKLNESGTADITENITYDFGDNERHGIYRIIPTYYKFRNGNPNQKISDLSVTDKWGVIQQVKRKFDFGKASYVVGDENALFTGIQSYVIKYTVSNVTNPLADKDSFYWNAIGDGWNVKIYDATVHLVLPTSVNLEQVSSACYAGGFGVNIDCTKLSQDSSGLVFFQSYLAPNEAMTIQADFPKGTFPAPSKLEVFFWTQPWPWIISIIFAVLIVYLWWKYGKDPEGRGTIVPLYEPPKDLTPMEASIILNTFGRKGDLSAEIIYLAVNGYIRITRTAKESILGKDDYLIEKLKPLDGTALHDNALVNALLIGDNPTKISEVKNTFFADYTRITDQVYKSIKEKGYIKSRPIYIVLAYMAFSVLLFFILGGIGIYLFAYSIKILPFLLPGAIFFLFSFVMPRRTKLGSEVREQLLGLKMYIKAAEIDRIKFHNEPKKDPAKFEELLPFAIVFGLEKEWSKQFEGIYTEEPNWYVGQGYAFSAVALADEIHTFSTFTNVNMASSASSGGGGFAGGGGGGGGGGSW